MRSIIVVLQLCLCLLAVETSFAAVSHVIHISIDGLRGDLLESYINSSPQDFPNFKRFVDEGATTFNGRTDYSNTETLPNHTSMLTGRPVEQPDGVPNTTHHGYLDNGSLSPTSTLHNSGNPNLSYISSTFDIVHDNGLSTALYASKDKFAIYAQSYTASTGAPDTTGADNGRDKIDIHLITPNFISMHNSFLSDMATVGINYSFLHYLLPDGVGHSAGWDSESWNNSVKTMDTYMGDMFDLIETNASLIDDTIIVLTADHGGTGTGHGTATDPANYTIPVLVWGAGVAPGADLYSLNPLSRLDPGANRPSYTASAQPIRNGDTGNLALHLLGLGPVAGSTINANQDLVVASDFEADFDANQSVDSHDLTIWQAGYSIAGGAKVNIGDANSDGNVDGSDFLVWQRQYGSSLVDTLTPVPEPSSMILMLLGVICFQQQTKRAGIQHWLRI
ncbi:alkaline phosphatase family protein [Bythopirellula goksoeyrii]|nr:alkaline phosphatase family protein [Bythopirellula goksoeyrii]